MNYITLRRTSPGFLYQRPSGTPISTADFYLCFYFFPITISAHDEVYWLSCFSSSDVSTVLWPKFALQLRDDVQRTPETGLLWTQSNLLCISKPPSRGLIFCAAVAPASHEQPSSAALPWSWPFDALNEKKEMFTCGEGRTDLHDRIKPGGAWPWCRPRPIPYPEGAWTFYMSIGRPVFFSLFTRPGEVRC